MYQVFPGMAWGLVTAVISPEALGTLHHKVYYKALPLLGIRWSIKKKYRTLPERFQGLGLPNFVVIVFVCKIFFLRCHWGFKGVTARMVMSTFETFMLKVGLYGNIFSQKTTRSMVGRQQIIHGTKTYGNIVAIWISR